MNRTYLKNIALFFVFLLFVSKGLAFTSLLTPSTTVINPGGSLDVTVSINATADSLLPGTVITSFAFAVDPFGFLVNITYSGATVLSEFDDSLFFPLGYVAGSWLTSPPDVTTGPIDLAVLHFTAANLGTDTISVEGLSANLEGAFLLGPSLDPIDFDIQGNLHVAVIPKSADPVPDSTTTAVLLLLSLSAVCLFRNLRAAKRA